MHQLGVALLIASAFGLLYVLFLYPLALEFVARRALPVRPAPILPTVTVLLPVHNGAPWLRRKLESILELDYPPDLLQIVVVSDGSGDETDAIAGAFPTRGVELVRIPRGGKALALNAGLERATGEILFYTDVRQTLDPGGLRHLVSFFADPTVGVVSGELVIRQGKSTAEQNTGLYWKYEKWIRRRHSRIDSVTGATGCIYTMRRSLAVPLPPKTLLDDVYLPMAAFFQGYRVLWSDGAKAFDYPTPLDAEYRRKVRTQAGIYQVIGFFPALLNPFRNRMWFHFCSHRVGRLLLPFFLIGLLLGTAALPWPRAGWGLAAQGLFYATALVDRCIPEGFPLKRLTSVVRTFVVLVMAALVAASIIVRPAKDFWTVTRVGDGE